MSITFGPWEAVTPFRSDDYSMVRDVTDDEGVSLIESACFTRDDDTNAANLRLVLAAPDLLAACEAMLELHESGSWGAPPGEYLPALRAAVSKATGEDDRAR